jgi:hypothetical protein
MLFVITSKFTNIFPTAAVLMMTIGNQSILMNRHVSKNQLMVHRDSRNF